MSGDENSKKTMPKRSLSQRIGELAHTALVSNTPNTWTIDKWPGPDYGYDYLVGINDGQHALATLYLQLKSTTQKSARTADGLHITQTLKLSTLRYWKNNPTPTFVVIVDFIDNERPKVAPVHYLFISPLLRKLISEAKADQKNITIKIPRSQIIDENLDVSEMIIDYLSDLELAIAEKEAFEKAKGSAVSEALGLGLASEESNSAYLITLADDSIDRCIAALQDNVLLKAALQSFRDNNFERTLALCPPPTEREINEEPDSSGARSYLRAQALYAIGSYSEADHYTNLAASLLPNVDAIAGAKAQQVLSNLQFDSNFEGSLNALIDTIDINCGIALGTVKSKALSLLGMFQEARNVLDRYCPKDTLVTKVVISIVERNWLRALDEIKTARLNPEAKQNQILWLHAFEAKAYLELSLQGVHKPEQEALIVPASGLQGMDFATLDNAYKSSMDAMVLAQRLGWPTDIKHMLDTFGISSMALGKVSEAIPLLTSLGMARASDPYIREVVTKILVQHNLSDAAISIFEAAGNSAPFKNEIAARAVAYVKAGREEEGLKLVTNEFLADPSTEDAFLSALMILGMAAQACYDLPLVESIKKRLSQDNFSRHYEAIFNSYLQTNDQILSRSQSLKYLFDYWLSHGKPAVVGHHVLINSDANSPEEAEQFVTVASEIEKTVTLNKENTASLARALMTLGRHGQAISRLRAALKRFDNDAQLLGLLGIALDSQGDVAEAYEIFEQLLKGGASSEIARRLYVEIASRAGFFNEAQKQIRAALAKSQNRRQKLNLLSMLFSLLLNDSDQSFQANNIAWEIGRVANSNDEQEEGMFLNMFLLSFQTSREEISAARIDEFQKRRVSYKEKFPDSKIFKSFETSKDAPITNFIADLNKHLGITEESIRENLRKERNMDSGSLTVPFSWRPRFFLSSVNDIFMLWELQKRSNYNSKSKRLQISASSYNRNIPVDLGKFKAIINLTSLILLDEIGALELALDTFPTVVIARDTQEKLIAASSSFLHNWGRDRAIRIIHTLQSRFDKISNPPRFYNEEKSNGPAWFIEEKHAMSQEGTVFFCDDIYETMMVCSDPKSSFNHYAISTADFLSWADQTAEIISPEEISNKIAMIIKSKVEGIYFEKRYLYAAITKELNEADTDSKGREARSRSDTFITLLDIVFNYSKPFDKQLEEFPLYILDLVMINAGDQVIVTVWLQWLASIRFQKNNLEPVQLLTASLISIINLVDDEILFKIWRCYISTVKEGLSPAFEKADEAEDLFAVRQLASYMGIMRADREHEGFAQDLHENKIMKFIPPGTQLSDLFNNVYHDQLFKTISEEISERDKPDA